MNYNGLYSAYGTVPNYLQPMQSRLAQMESMYQPQMQMQQNMASPISWVNKKDDVHSFNVMNNSASIFMDKNQNKFYIKSVDQYGKPEVKAFTFVEDKDESSAENELEKRIANIEAVLAKIVQEKPARKSKGGNVNEPDISANEQASE